MKTLKHYIAEEIKDLDDYWFIEEFVDSDTGEIIPVLRMKDSPKILAFLKKAKREEDKIQDKIDELEQKLYYSGDSDYADELQEEIDDLKDECDKYRAQYNALTDEMEDYAGELQQKYDIHTGEGWDKYDSEMNNYGGNLQDIADKIEDCENKIKELEEKLNKQLDREFDDWKTLKKDIDAQVSKLEKELKTARDKNRIKYEEMRADFAKKHPAPEN